MIDPYDDEPELETPTAICSECETVCAASYVDMYNDDANEYECKDCGRTGWADNNLKPTF